MLLQAKARVIGADGDSHEAQIVLWVMTSFVVISPRGEERLQSGHPWIYRADVIEARSVGGERVRVRNRRGQTLGYAFFSDRSQIALRMLTVGDQPADDQLIRERVRRAIEFRRSLGIRSDAYRLIHGEADLLPSLIVDRYGDYLVIQTLSQGMDRLAPLVQSALEDEMRPRGILARNDPRARTLEGLEQRVDVLMGDIPDQVAIAEDGIQNEADLKHGQKTGLFLDQRENREAAAGYARGRVLDCFSYNGGFALRMASRAEELVAIDISESAIERVRANASRNNVEIDARVGNVFDDLRGMERLGERFDTIVLDPPAFAKSKVAVPKAAAGYKEINLRALKLLSPGGTLITCSCSYNVGEAAFAEIVSSAAMDARIQVTVVEKRMQSRDHPVLLAAPETYYLKCFILRKIA
jgi:23S rRNA (cytosine1962-C5)-methyltransferase